VTARHGGPRPNQTGRPPRADVAATERITLYVTPGERDEIDRAVTDKNTNVNAWAVPIVVRAAKRQNRR
jgi:uncharacterized protein (DUF1778 family)